MVQKAKKLKNNFFRAYANAGIILFIPTMLVKKLEANFESAYARKKIFFKLFGFLYHGTKRIPKCNQNMNKIHDKNWLLII